MMHSLAGVVRVTLNVSPRCSILMHGLLDLGMSWVVEIGIKKVI